MSSRQVRVATIQCAFSPVREENVAKVGQYIETAAKEGAQIVLPPELFEGPYFCAAENADFFRWAMPLHHHPTVQCMQSLAKKLSVVLPVSLFEKDIKIIIIRS